MLDHSKRKILVVDDDRIMVTLVRFALKEAGFQVETAADGVEGLNLVKANPPDLIVLDIQMPKMSGFEFLTELRSINPDSPIPVLVLTANENMQDVFFMEGVKGYFVKPVEPPVLLAKIKECLA